MGTIDLGGDVDGMAWFSADGTAWRTVPLGTAGFTGRAEQAVHAVTATAGGFVAVGDDAGGERRVAAVWTSPDGISWQRQPPSPEMAELPTAESTDGVSARAIAGDGLLVAVGGGYSLQVWTSQDGRRWNRQEPPVHKSRSGDEALVTTDGRAVLVDVGAAGLWFRGPDGRWAEVGSDRDAFPRPAHTYQLDAMSRTGGRFVAFGTEGPDTALWLSPDGRAWERQRDLTGVFRGGHVDALTTFAGLAVGVGAAGHPSEPDENVAAVWTSADDGVSWQRVDPANAAFSIRGTTQMFGITAGRPGLVAVGLSYEVRGTIDAHAWFSPDGRSWRRAADPPAWSGPGDQLLSVACPLPGGGVVALGTTTVQGEADVWAWTSQDGLTWEPAAGEGVAALRGPGGQYPADCASTGARVLVAGTTAGAGGADGVLWATTDGRSWSVVADGTFGGPGGESARAVAADGDRVVVASREDQDTTVYSSVDGGTTWKRWTGGLFRGFGSQIAYQLVIAGDEVVAAGIDQDSIAVWIGPAP